MVAIGYVRVSTEDQAKEGVSLDTQKSKIMAYCVLKDLELQETVEDAGISAKDLRRAGVQKVSLLLFPCPFVLHSSEDIDVDRNLVICDDVNDMFRKVGI